MLKNVIKCPKCKKSNLLITEVAEVHFATRYANGQFSGQTSENTATILRQIATCLEQDCLHEWTFRKDLDLGEIPRLQPDESIIEYTCIQCNKPKKIRPAATSTFDPAKHVCPECELGLEG